MHVQRAVILWTTLLTWECTVVAASRPHSNREIQESWQHHNKAIDQALRFHDFDEQLGHATDENNVILKESKKLPEEKGPMNEIQQHHKQQRWSNKQVVRACLSVMLLVITLRLLAAWATRSEDDTSSTPAAEVGKIVSSSHLAGRILTIAGSQMIPNFCSVVVSMVTLLLVTQRKQDTMVASIGLANVFSNGIVVVLHAGGGGGIVNFVSPAHGANEHRLCCEYIQSFTIIVAMQLIWVVPLFWFSGTWLVHLGQDEEVSRQCGSFLQASTLGLIFDVHSYAVHSGLLSMQITFMPNFLMALTTLVSCVANYVLFEYHDLGMSGLGMSKSISSVFYWYCLMMYVSLSAETSSLRRHRIYGLSKSCLSHISRCFPVFVQTALPVGMFMWFYEINALMVGTLGAEQLSGHVVAFTAMESIYQTVTSPFMSATQIVVGGLFGAGQAQLAKQAACICPAASVVATGVVCLFGYLAEQSLCEMLAPSSTTQKLVRDLLQVAFVILMIQAVQVVLTAMLLCMRKQWVVASTLPFTCYMIVWPIGWYLAFRRLMGAWGIWSASCLGCGLNCVIFGAVLLGVDWEKCVAEGLQIIKEDAAKAQSPKLAHEASAQEAVKDESATSA